MREIIVSKFGGTSNCDAEAVARCMELADRDSLVTVVSAPGKLKDEAYDRFQERYQNISPELAGKKVTDLLLLSRKEYVERGEVPFELTELITARFEHIVSGLGDLGMRSWVNDIPVRVRSAVGIGDDYASMLGEQLQAEIYASAGWEMLDPSTSGRELVPDDYEAWADWLKPQVLSHGKNRYVLPGNIYFDGERLRTFDRGGSDISGALAARALQATVYRNWTDTPAQSVSPEIIADPKRRQDIDNLTYREGRELGRNGTGLLHPDAMTPLMGMGIPTEIRDTFNPNNGHTTMTDEPTTNRDGQVMAISSIPNVSVVELTEPGMSSHHGRVAEVTSRIAERGVNLIDTVGYGADTMLYLVDPDKTAATIAAIEQACARTNHEVGVQERALITLVGRNIIKRALDIRVELALNAGLGKHYQQETPHWFEGQHSMRFTVRPEDANEIIDSTHQIFFERHRLRGSLLTEE